MQSLSPKRILFIIAQFSASLAVAYLLISLAAAPEQAGRTASRQAAAAAALPAEPKLGAFASTTLLAKSAVVYDIATGQVLFGKEKDEIRPIASITKLMTAYAASVALPPSAVVEIAPEDASLESSAGIVAGERWRLADLTAFTLVSSSNGGAQAIARAAEQGSGRKFIVEMNDLARQIGLQNTLFRNETGLDLYENEVSGSYSTAHDIARLYSYLVKRDPAVLAGTDKGWITTYSIDNVRHEAANTNQLVGRIPNLVSSKTGTTDLAGGNLAIVFNATSSRPVAVVVLGSTPQGRFSDMQKLVDAAIEAYK